MHRAHSDKLGTYVQHVGVGRKVGGSSGGCLFVFDVVFMFSVASTKACMFKSIFKSI
jgi:hypothetical protein